MAGLEKVHTVTDYYDGPRGGVAEFPGQPHYYECQLDESSGDGVALYDGWDVGRIDA